MSHSEFRLSKPDALGKAVKNKRVSFGVHTRRLQLDYFCSCYNFELSNSQIVDFRTTPGLVSSSTIIVRMFCADYIASFVFHGFVSAGFLEGSFRGYFGANHAPSKVASIMSTPPVAFVNGSLAGAQYKYIFGTSGGVFVLLLFSPSSMFLIFMRGVTCVSSRSTS